MNILNIFKPLAQQLINAALPALKAQLKSQITLALSKSTKVGPDSAPIVMAELAPIIDAWTVKL